MEANRVELGRISRGFCGIRSGPVAQFNEFDVERVLETPGILRMQRKVRATIANAGALVETERELGKLRAYLRSFESYPALAKDMKKRFAFMGDMNVWYFLFRTGEPVPRFEAWVATIPGDHPRMREMVDLARSQGRAQETRTGASSSGARFRGVRLYGAPPKASIPNVPFGRR